MEEEPRAQSGDRLRGGVAHEFNNADGVGYAELVTRAATDDRQRATRRSSWRPRAAATAFLPSPGTCSAAARPERECEYQSRLARGERVELRLELDEASDAILADPSLVEQAILALVANACDAMPGGGVLLIATGGAVVAEGDRGPDDLPPGRYVTLAVTDTGVGIAPEVREHLFEPFFTTKGDGPPVGLGLASVQGIVRQSGGAVQVESVPGTGAVFRVWLPVLGAAAGERPPACPQPRENGEAQRFWSWTATRCACSRGAFSRTPVSCRRRPTARTRPVRLILPPPVL